MCKNVYIANNVYIKLYFAGNAYIKLLSGRHEGGGAQSLQLTNLALIGLESTE